MITGSIEIVFEGANIPVQHHEYNTNRDNTNTHNNTQVIYPISLHI